MFGLEPAQQAHIIQAALISLVILVGITPEWIRRQYTIRGLFKRIRCHL